MNTIGVFDEYNRFVFWQNILSIHQSSFLKSLAEKKCVILVVEKSIEERRMRHGWEIPDFGNTEIIINPDNEKINELLSIKNTIHIFSGINAYPLIKKGLKLAIQKNVKIGIISEPFNWLGLKGKLRFMKYLFYKFQYNRHISFILAIGNKGRWCFEKTGFTKNKIFDWGYFTENIEFDILHKNQDRRNILYAGSIDKRKNILGLVESCIKNEKYISQFTIIGNGPLEDTLIKKIKSYSFINYLGGVNHIEIYKHIIRSDLLILPSIFDGWGAIVNESLMCGIPALVSDHCGSSILVKDIRGKVFSVKKKNLEHILQSFLIELPHDYEKRQKIQKWAENNISGKSASHYFSEIMSYVLFHQTVRPIAPWLKDDII